MNLDHYDIITDKLNNTSKALPKRRYYWTLFKKGARGVSLCFTEYFSMAREEYEFAANKIYKRDLRYNILNLHEVPRDKKFISENNWILEQYRQQIGPLPEKKPEKQLIESALKKLNRQRLIIAADRMFYKSPRTQPPPRIATEWNAPRAIICRCPKHECQCVMRKTVTANDKSIPKGKRFFHIPFKKEKPPPGLILSNLSERIKERTQYYDSPEGQEEMKKLGVEICMAGCLSFAATCFLMDPKDKAAMKELNKITKRSKKKKKRQDDIDEKIPKKRKGKKGEKLRELKPTQETGMEAEVTDEMQPEIFIDDDLEHVAKGGVPEPKVPKDAIICNMFYNTVATQTERNKNDELIIGDYSHIIFACPEETTLCDIEGMKLGIKPYDFTELHQSKMDKLFHVNELKEHISKIKSVLYDPVFEIVQEKLNKRSDSCGAVSLDDFIKSVQNVTKKCQSSVSRRSSKATLGDEEDGDISHNIEAEIYLPWISLHKLSRLRESFLKYVRGDLVNEDEVSNYFDTEPDACKGCLPPSLITDAPSEGKQGDISDPFDGHGITNTDEKSNICNGNIPSKIHDDKNLKYNTHKDETDACKYCFSSDSKSTDEINIPKGVKSNDVTGIKDIGNTNDLKDSKDQNKDWKDSSEKSAISKKPSSEQSKFKTKENNTTKAKKDKKKSQSKSDMKKSVSEKKPSAKFSVSFGEFKEKIFQRDPWRPCVPTESEIEYNTELKRRREKQTGNVCECEQEEDTCWKRKRSYLNSESNTLKEGTSKDSKKGILKSPSRNKSGSNEFEDNKVVGYFSDIADMKNSSELQMFTHSMDGTTLVSNSKTLMRVAMHKLKIW